MTMTGDPAARRGDTDGTVEVTTVGRRLPADVVRVAIAGEIDSTTVDAFRQALDRAATDSPGRLEVDLSAVRFFACAGVHVVVGMRPATPGLVVVGASASVRRLFTLASAADVLS